MTENSGQSDGVINLDKPRRLRWSLKGLREINRLQGEDIPQMDMVTRILLLGLQWEDPDLTEEALEEMLNTDNLGDVMEAINGVTKRINQKAGEAGPPLAGPTSGPLPATTSGSRRKSSGRSRRKS